MYAHVILLSAINLCMGSATQRRRYIVTLSLFGWAHTQNDPWLWFGAGEIVRVTCTRVNNCLGISDATMKDMGNRLHEFASRCCKSLSGDRPQLPVHAVEGQNLFCSVYQWSVRAVATNWTSIYMMTSSNGNFFRVAGPLCGEFTGHRWIPRTKGSDAELLYFRSFVPE